MWKPELDKLVALLGGNGNTAHETDVVKSAPHQEDTNAPTDGQGGQKGGNRPKINAEHGERIPSKLPEEWQAVGSDLHKANHELQQNRQRNLGLYGHVGRHEPVILERDIDAKPEHVPSAEADSLHFLGSKNVRFWGDGTRAFAAYYVKSASGECDLHFRVLANDGVETIKVNDRPVSPQDSSNYPPAFVAFDKDGAHKVVFATLERGTSDGRAAAYAGEVAVKAYSVNSSGAVSIEEEKSIKLNDGKRAGLYSQPLSVARDDKGDIVIVSRAKDRRANPSDQAYVMWRLSSKDFSLIKPRSRTDASNRHLFSRAGANPKTGTPEQLIVWGSRAGKLGLTYVGRYVHRKGQQYTMLYKAHYADIPYSLRSQTAECSTGAPRCYIGGQTVALSESDAIGPIDHIELQGTRYTIYVDEQGTPQQSLSIAAYDGKTRKVFRRVLNFDAQPTSMNVKLLEDGSVGITVVDESSVVRMCELRLDKLMLGRCGCSAYATSVNAKDLDIREFINIASQGLQLVPRINAVSTSTNTVSVVVGNHGEQEALYLDVTEFAYPVRYLQASGQQPEETTSGEVYELTTHAEGALGTTPGEVAGSASDVGLESTKHGDASVQPHVTTEAAEHTTPGSTPRTHQTEHPTDSTHTTPYEATIRTWPGSSTEFPAVITPYVGGAHGAMEYVHNDVGPRTHHKRNHGSSSSVNSTEEQRGVTTLGQNRSHVVVGNLPAGGAARVIAPLGGDHARFARSADSSTVGSSASSSTSDAIKWGATAGGIALLVALVVVVAVFVARYRRVVNFRNRIYRLDCDESLDLFYESGPRSSYVVEGASEQVCLTSTERSGTNASAL
ncbi:MAG: hypothetical protein AB8U31_04445 [Anaplasma ovis]